MPRGHPRPQRVLGEGSTFWFTVRLEQCPADRQVEAVSDHDLQGLSVLIVDDNATSRQILRHRLAIWNMLAEEAASGPQALQMLRAAAARGEPYALAILDVHMPAMGGVELANAIKAEPAIAAVPLVMLTSMGMYEEISHAQLANVLGYLHKPVRQDPLHQCLLAALGTPVAAVNTELSPPAVERRIKPAAFHGRILLTEDSPVNQEVALNMLENLGCQVDVAGNGREAIEALERTTYDLVFMDCQMPTMDGYEATRYIRNREVAAAQQSITIIALTANAMQGDRERCLAAGMTDYLSKPFELRQLQDMLARWLPPQPAPEAAQRQLVTPPVANVAPAVEQGVLPSTSIDHKSLAAIRALQRDGKPDVLSKVIQMYFVHSPKLLDTPLPAHC